MNFDENDNTTPDLSVIIPHKNSSLLLLRLLATIPDTTSIEIIIVDDNSNEEEKCALKTSLLPANAKVIFSKESGYAGKARNCGLKSAVGTWVIFADADDYFSKDFFDIVKPYFMKINLDIVYFSVSSVDGFGNLSYRHIPYKELVENHLSGSDSEQDIRYRHTPPWAKLFNRQFLLKEKILFDEVPASNDISFSVRSGHLAGHIAVCPNAIYTVTQRIGSITNTVNKKNLESKFNAALRVNKFLRGHKKNKYQHSVLYFIYRAWTLDKSMAVKMLLTCIGTGNNIFIGLSKVSNIFTVIKQRESR